MMKPILSLILFILLGLAGACMFIDGIFALDDETHQGVRNFLAFYSTFGFCVGVAGFSLAIDLAARLHQIPTKD